MKKIKHSMLALSLAPLVALAATAHVEEHHTHGNEHRSHAGQPGDPGNVTRTVNVSMNDDMRFKPSRLSIKKGETVRFVVRNLGKTQHEMVIGNSAELREHAEMMRKMPEMIHTGENQLSLEPGQRGTIVWQFDKPGTVDFACLVPGHFEAGMIGKIVVK